MMKNIIGFIASLFIITLFTPVLADDPITPNSRSGIYFGAGGLHAIEDFDANQLNFDSAAGFNLRLGYRFHPYFAVEAMGERVDAFDLTSVDFFGGGFGGNFDEFKFETNTWTGTLNGKIFASTGRIQPYALAGIGFMQAQLKEKSSFFTNNFSTNFFGLTFRYGAGMDAYLTENWVGSIEFSYVHPITSEIDGLNYLSLGGGIQYRF